MGVQNEYDSTTSDYLMHATLSVMANDQCNSLLDKKRFETADDLNVGFLQDMICAGYPDGGRDACQVWFEPMAKICGMRLLKSRSSRWSSLYFHKRDSDETTIGKLYVSLVDGKQT